MRGRGGWGRGGGGQEHSLGNKLEGHLEDNNLPAHEQAGLGRDIERLAVRLLCGRHLTSMIEYLTMAIYP